MHNGNFATLADVVDHSMAAPPGVLGRNELLSLQLDAEQKTQLVAFLETLDEQPAEVADPWRQPPVAGVAVAALQRFNEAPRKHGKP